MDERIDTRRFRSLDMMNNSSGSGEPRTLEQFDMARPREVCRLEAQLDFLDSLVPLLAGAFGMGVVLLLATMPFSQALCCLCLWSTLFILPVGLANSARASARERIPQLAAEHATLMARTGGIGPAAEPVSGSEEMPTGSMAPRTLEQFDMARPRQMRRLQARLDFLTRLEIVTVVVLGMSMVLALLLLDPYLSLFSLAGMAVLGGLIFVNARGISVDTRVELRRLTEEHEALMARPSAPVQRVRPRW